MRPPLLLLFFSRINLLSQSDADHNVTRTVLQPLGVEVSHIDNCHIITQKRDAHRADVNYDHFWCHCQTVHGRLDKIIVTPADNSELCVTWSLSNGTYQLIKTNVLEKSLHKWLRNFVYILHTFTRYKFTGYDRQICHVSNAPSLCTGAVTRNVRSYVNWKYVTTLRMLSYSTVI